MTEALQSPTPIPPSPPCPPFPLRKAAYCGRTVDSNIHQTAELEDVEQQSIEWGVERGAQRERWRGGGRERALQDREGSHTVALRPSSAVVPIDCSPQP